MSLSDPCDIYYEVMPDTPGDDALNTAQLREMVASGAVLPTARVWRTGMGDWTPLKDVPLIWQSVKPAEKEESRSRAPTREELYDAKHTTPEKEKEDGEELVQAEFKSKGHGVSWTDPEDAAETKIHDVEPGSVADKKFGLVAGMTLVTVAGKPAAGMAPIGLKHYLTSYPLKVQFRKIEE